MLNKFRTEVAAVAFKANSEMPKDYQATVERDLNTLIHLYTALFCRGKRDALMQAVSTVALAEMAHIVSSLPPEVLAQMQNISAPAATAAKCLHCGGAHESKDH